MRFPLRLLVLLGSGIAIGCRPPTSAAPTPAPLSASPAPVVVAPTAPPTPLPLAEPLRERLSEAATLLRQQNAGALEALAALEKDAVTSAVLSEQLAGLYEELDFTDKIYPLSLQATRLDPTYGPGFVRLGRIEQHLGYYALAEKHLQEATRLSPQSSDPFVALGLYYLHTLKSNAVTALEKAIALDPQEWRIRLLLNQALLNEKAFPKAVQVLDDAQKVAPDQAIIPMQKASTLNIQAREEERLGHADAALKLRKEALPLAEGAIQKLAESGSSWFYLAQLREALGDSAGAREAYEKTYALSPKYQNIGYVLGQQLLRSGDKARGQKLIAAFQAEKSQKERYQQLVLEVSQVPGDPERRRKLARYCVEQKLIHRALFEWEQLLVQKPGDPEARRAVESWRAQRIKDMTQ
jgi:cytochrome c-type biogenesis protein CcmH/NrfG